MSYAKNYHKTHGSQTHPGGLGDPTQGTNQGPNDLEYVDGLQSETV